MARQISRAEAWERAHEVFTQVNFNAFDYNTIKESLLDYVKLYFPEDFNDYIESSEFIAILELFAYVGELLAYRLDLNAHENFITTAQRKESILRLAKLISYKASRNIPARGLVKLTAIQTTERVSDSNGRNLAGRTIYWNDANNTDWKEQFILIMNRVFEQEFGSVQPSERVQVDDVLFELYTLNNNPITQNGRSVLSYSAVASTGNQVPMELVPVSLTRSGPEERRPEINGKFSLLYANDGLGDGSDTTGFLIFTKQGTLGFQVRNFDGVTPNQTLDVTINNINETDVWINNVDPDTGEILINDPYADVLPHLVAEDLRYGEWIEVDLANAQNINFNTNRNRHKYEIETLDNDNIRIIFGDGEFSDIPSGTFHIWYRTSLNDTYIVERNSVVNKTVTITYNDVNNTVQTLTLTFSLISTLQNASASEDIEHIRRVAPSVYYTQDRMVNGRDYNVFMLQDPSILKLRAVNRTFSGDSKYIAWHDPRENYEDVKMFGDDLALYWTEKEPDEGGLFVINSPISSESLLNNYIEPLLSSTDFFAKIAPLLEQEGLNPNMMRRTFKGETQPYSFASDSSYTGQPYERAAIVEALNLASTTTPVVNLFFSVLYDEWTIGNHFCDGDGTGVTTPSYQVTSSTSSVNESETFTVTLSTNGVLPGVIVPYTITGVTSGDIDGAPLSGSFVVGSVDSITFTTTADLTTEGNETFKLTLNGPFTSATELISTLSTSVTINDTSLSSTYTLSSNVASVNEGNAFVITLTTTNVLDGTLVPYTITGVSTSDIDSAPLTGSFTVTSNTSAITFNTVADLTTEGNETFTLSLDNGADTISVTINDTSLTPSYSLTPSVTTVNEGDTFTVTLSSVSIASGTVVPYTITGISTADISGASLTGTFTVGSDETKSFVVTADATTEGSEVFTMTLDIAPVSTSVTINDTSTAATAFDLTLTIASPTSNWDFVNQARAAGWPGLSPVNATINVNAGVSVYSTVAGPTGYGMRITPAPATYPTATIPGTSTITLNNNGYIVGKGGAGGTGGNAINSPGAGAGSTGSPALTLGYQTTVNNGPAAFIAGGGGGGGGGGGAYNQFVVIAGKGPFAIDSLYAGGSAGGGGAHGAPVGSPTAGGSGGSTPAPGPTTWVSSGASGGTGGVTQGAGGSTAALSIATLTGIPTAIINATAGGGAGGSGGAKGSSGSAGSVGNTTAASGSLTIPGSPLNVRASYSGAAGGLPGRSINGVAFKSPSSVTPAPTIFGPQG